MDEIVRILMGTSSEDEQIRAQSLQAIAELTNQKDFYQILITILSSQCEPYIYTLAASALRIWIKNVYNKLNSDEEEVKFQIIQFIQQYILQNHPATEHLIECYNCILYIHVFDLIPFFTELSQLIGFQTDYNFLINILKVYKMIGYRFIVQLKPSMSHEELVNKVLEPLMQFFGNSALVTTSEGCHIMAESVRVFKSIYSQFNKLCHNIAFNICCSNLATIPDSIPDDRQFFDMHQEVAWLLYDLISNLILNFHHQKDNEIDTMINQCIDLTLQYIIRFYQTGFPNWIYESLLKSLALQTKQIPVNQDIVTLLLSLAQLTEQELADFENNPRFYIEAYLSHSKKHEDKLCRDYVCDITKSIGEANKNIILFLLAENPCEHVMFLVAQQIYNISMHSLIEELYAFVLKAIDQIPDQFYLASLLYMIGKTITFIEKPEWNERVNEFVLQIISSSNSDVIADECFRIFYELLVLDHEVPEELFVQSIEFSQNFISKNAMKFIAKYIETNKDFNKEHIGQIIDNFLPDIDNCIINSRDVSNFIEICQELIHTGGIDSITSDLLEFIEHYLNEPVVSSVEPVCALIASIFMLDHNELTPQLMQGLLISMQFDVTMDALSYIIDTILILLNLHKNAFSMYNISVDWMNLVLSKCPGSDTISLAMIISLIIQSDPDVDDTGVNELISSRVITHKRAIYIIIATLAIYKNFGVDLEFVDELRNFLNYERTDSYSENHLYYIFFLKQIQVYPDHATDLYTIAQECIHGRSPNDEALHWPVFFEDFGDLNPN